MKITEFRKLIREEITKIIKEDRYSDIASAIKFDPAKVIAYKVGNGNREGAPVTVKNLKQVIGKPLQTIELIEKYGVTFNKAYVNIRSIGRSYWPSGSGTTLTYTLFGKDSQGNEIIYDKYEGKVAGGGQAFIFVNGKKQAASQYLLSLTDKSAELERLMNKLLPNVEISIDEVSDREVYVQIPVPQIALLSRNRSKLQKFWNENGLPKSVVFNMPWYGRPIVTISSNKRHIAEYSNEPDSFVLG